MSNPSSYVPALSHNWLTPFYDILIRWTMPEASFKRRLIAEATIANNQHLLDLGCGTATLTLLIKELHLDATVTGIDGDEKILQIGRTKVKKAGTAITLARALAFRLPYPDRSFDSRAIESHVSSPNARKQSKLFQRDLSSFA